MPPNSNNHLRLRNLNFEVNFDNFFPKNSTAIPLFISINTVRHSNQSQVSPLVQVKKVKRKHFKADISFNSLAEMSLNLR